MRSSAPRPPAAWGWRTGTAWGARAARGDQSAPRRAASLDPLISAAPASGLGLENWYGVRIAVDAEELDPPPPSDPQELAALLDVEERLGATAPCPQPGRAAPRIL